MDVNGTRYQLLLGEDDWAACSDGRVRVRPAAASPVDEGAADLAWDGERSELTLSPLLFQFVTPPKDTPPSLAVRRGAARDRYGDWYWVDATARRVLALREGEAEAETFWPAAEAADAPPDGAGEFRPLRAEGPRLTRFLGLTITDDQYLVVGMLEPAGLLVFDLYDTREPLRILWPGEVPFSPFDMAAAPGGGLWILDRDNRRFWGLDRRFNVLAQGQDEVTLAAAGRDDFQPRDPRAGRRAAPNTFPSGVSLDFASPLAADDPISIEALPDGTVLILDRNPAGRFSHVYRYDFRRQLGQPVSTRRMERIIRPEERAAFGLTAFDFAYVPAHDGPGGRASDRLYFAAADGNQVFAFAVSGQGEQLSMEPLPDYLPMRKFGGRGLAAVGAKLFYDFGGGGWIPLVEQRRPRFLQEATLYTPIASDEEADDEEAPHAFDGREPDCVWNRLMLDACIPPETEVLVESRAANDERELAEAEWRPEPRPYLRGGAELPFVRRQTPALGDGTWELLFQKARGRYLQLRLTLKGNGRTTPRLRALRAYYPRFSYLEQYMPAVYREDEVSASFLDRFLANFEGLYTSLEDRVAAAHMLFDVRSAPAEALEWLAGWFGLALDPTWDEARRRLFIKHAPTFFQARGTVRGLRWALRLALDDCPSDDIFDESRPKCATAGGIRIIERFRTRLTPGVVLGDPTDGAPKKSQKSATRWRPEQGGNALNALYKEFLGAAAPAPSAAAARPVLTKAFTAALAAPKGDYTLRPAPEVLDRWSQFSREALGFVPAATLGETALWQGFLKRRHRQIQQLNQLYKTGFKSFEQVYLPGDMPVLAVRLRDWLDFVEETARSSARRRAWQNFLALRYHRVGGLNAAYGTHWPSFEVVSLPEELPADGAPLRDWYQFESIVLPLRDAAHRFTVLLPMRASADPEDAEGLRRRSIAERVVNLEKPAHTTFDIKFYWELFRLGEARLGEDSLLNLGGRAPQLMTPLTLGRGRLAESYLMARQTTPADRPVLGRDPLAG